MLRYALYYVILKQNKIKHLSYQCLSSVIRFLPTFCPITQTHTLHINTKAALLSCFVISCILFFTLVLLICVHKNMKLLRMGDQQQLDGLCHQLYLRSRNLVGCTIQLFWSLQFSFVVEFFSCDEMNNLQNLEL